MIDKYIYIIVALLPLTAVMLVFQTNPYHALVIRAILGAIAVLVYAILGAADVALTEALVGTMLAVTLYVVAIRSSLVMNLGIINNSKIKQNNHFQELINQLRKTIKKYHLRLELVEYSDEKSLEKALENQEIHGICSPTEIEEKIDKSNLNFTYHLDIRINRLFEILKKELNHPLTTINYFQTSNQEK